MQDPQLSIHAAPYVVKLVTGKKQLHSRVRDIYESHRQSEVASVFDRKGNGFLDLTTLWKSHRRKIVDK